MDEFLVFFGGMIVGALIILFIVVFNNAFTSSHISSHEPIEPVYRITCFDGVCDTLFIYQSVE